MSDKTRAWAKRWSAKMNGMVPGLLHAAKLLRREPLAEGGEGCGHHGCGRSGGKMKAMPVNDFFDTNVKIRENGRADE